MPKGAGQLPHQRETGELDFFETFDEGAPNGEVEAELDEASVEGIAPWEEPLASLFEDSGDYRFYEEVGDELETRPFARDFGRSSVVATSAPGRGDLPATTAARSRRDLEGGSVAVHSTHT